MGRYFLIISIVFLSIAESFAQQHLETISNNYCWFHYYHSDNDFWLGCEKGWSHHKNGDIQHFLMDDTLAGLKGNYIQSNMHKGGANQLFAASYTHINRYDTKKNKFTSFQIKKNKTTYYQSDYHVIDIDTSLHQMYVKAEMDILIYDYTKNTIVEKIDTANSSVRFDISDDRKKLIGVRWTHGTGVDIYEKINEKWTKRELLKSVTHKTTNFVGRQVILDDNTAYITSNIGLIELNTIDNTFKTLELKNYKQEQLYFIEKYYDNIIWSGVQGKIGLYNTKNKSVYYPPDLQLFTKNIDYSHSLFLKENTLFIGYQGGGFYKYDIESTFNSGFTNHGIDEVQKIFNLDGSLIVLRKNLLSKYEDNRLIKNVLISNLSDQQNAVYEVNVYDQKLYLINENYLLVYDQNINLIQNIKHNINERITNMVINDGQILVTAFQRYYTLAIADLGKSKLSKLNFHLAQPSSLSHGIDLKQSHYASQNGDLYINGKKIENIGYLNHLQISRVDDYILSAKKGLYHINNGSLNQIKLSPYVNDNIIYGSDRQGNEVWVTSTNGLFQYNLNTNEFVRIPRFNTFSLDEKPPAIVGNKVYVLASGQLYSINNEVSMYKNVAEVKLKNITVDGILQAIHPTVDVGYNFNSLSINFTSGEAGEQYYYRNLIFDSLYKKVENNRIEFQGLKPGKYPIEIFKIGANNLQSGTYVQGIKVAKPFWQRFDFILFSLISIFGLSYYINYQLTKNKLEKERLKLEKALAINEQRMSISRDLHDEIGSGLTAIKYLTVQGTPATDQLPQTIHQLSTNLIDNMRDMLWSLDEENDTSESLVARIRISSQHFFKNSGIRSSIVPNINEGIVIIGSIRKAVILMTKEAFTNIIKHSQASQVIISININEQYLLLTISDDGRGIVLKKSEEKSYGLDSMRKRIEGIKGQITISSSEKGTIIDVKVPLV